jgi:hypothetical protein
LYTVLAILVSIVSLIVWDIITAARGGTGTTISALSYAFMYFHPMLALAVGGLVGHLTWGSPGVPPDRVRELITLAVAAVLLVLVDVFSIVPPMLPLWPFLLGIPIGHAFFGQDIAPAARWLKS